MDAQDRDIKITNVERLNRKAGVNWMESQSIKLTFSGDYLPEHVSVGHLRYRISPFVQPPLQCYNCQRMGHIAATCKSTTRCMLCGDRHKRTDCNADQTRYKCANCGLNHRANDPTCIHYIQAKEVELVRSTKTVNFFQAKKIVVENNKYTPSAQSNINVRPNYSYANSVLNINATSPVSEQTASTSSAYAPTPLANAPTPLAIAPTSSDKPTKPLCTNDITKNPEFQTALKNCLLDILSNILPDSLLEKTNLKNVVTEQVNVHFKKRTRNSSSSDSSTSEASEMDQGTDTNTRKDLNATFSSISDSPFIGAKKKTKPYKKPSNKKLK